MCVQCIKGEGEKYFYPVLFFSLAVSGEKLSLINPLAGDHGLLQWGIVNPPWFFLETGHLPVSVYMGAVRDLEVDPSLGLIWSTPAGGQKKTTSNSRHSRGPGK